MTTSPLRAVDATSKRRSQPSHGLSTVSSRSSAFSLMRTFDGVAFRRVDPEVALRLVVVARCDRFSLRTPCTDHCRCARPRSTSRSRSATNDAYVVFGVSACRGARVEVALPTSAVLRRGARVFVELEHARDRALQERAIVTHHDDSTRQRLEEPFEPRQPVEVEIVGRLVEQEHVELAQQHRGQRHARGLTTRERRRRHVEQVLGEPEVGAHRTHASVEVGGAGSQVGIECVGVVVVAAGRTAGERARRSLELGSASVTPVRRARSSNTVSWSSRAWVCGRYPTRNDGGVAVTVPESGASSPASKRSSVVLPTPLGPSTPRRV